MSNSDESMDICDTMLDPYNREKALRLQIKAISFYAQLAADELQRLAGDIRLSHTKGDGEWPPSEREAKAEYDKLHRLAANLQESTSWGPAKHNELLREHLAAKQKEQRTC